MKQYEIWWASLPKPAGRRPVLLLSRDSAYSYLRKFLAVEITSTIRNIVEEVPLGPTEGLPRPCVANCDNIRTVAREVLEKRIGRLGPGRAAELKRALGHALSWSELIDAV
ncbi:MAG TPA: type II toxin-antitoxin system PemK/MazF family toxin [Bryobacteraceae bacterium]|nr:type II toxin-antitoxin system PemK/MazF family toxin [Bryobacteraceae bacterium]